jgi:hypothetical protein
MSFADLRQTVLASHVLSTDWFGELVEVDAPDDSAAKLSVAAKIESVPPYIRRGDADGRNEGRRGTIDEREWIQVTFNRNALAANSYPGRPQIACALKRGDDRDPDPRPYTFRGQIVFEGDQRSTYIFERPRRAAQGRGVSSAT